MTYQEFCAQFERIPKAANAFSRIDPNHPLDIYMGDNDSLHPTLLIVGTDCVDAKYLHDTNAIKIQNVILDNRKALTFSYIQSPYNNIFSRLCFDMLESSRNEQGNGKYLKLVQRYIAWYNMFTGKKSDILTKEQQKGLCGELLFLEQKISERPIVEALTAWQGPLEADQDFVFADSWAEIKSVKLSATAVTISSLEQLQLESPGMLIVYKLEDTNSEDQDRFSLHMLVERITRAISNSVDAVLLFKEKLYFAGYDPEEESYKQTFFKIREKFVYSVIDDFPRLTQMNTPVAIVEAKYQIDLAAINEYRREDF